METNVVQTSPEVNLNVSTKVESGVSVESSSIKGGIDVTPMPGVGDINLSTPSVIVHISSSPTKSSRYDWIKGDGKSYFNTGYAANENTWYEIKVRTMLGSDRSYFGSRIKTADSNDYFGFSAHNIWVSYIYFGRDIYVNTQNVSYYHKAITCKMRDKKIYVNEELKGEVTGTFVYTGLPLFIFACCYSLSQRALSNQENYIYYVKFYEGDTLVHYYRAATDLDGVICIYDEVEHRFLYNQYTESDANLTVGNDE